MTEIPYERAQLTEPNRHPPWGLMLVIVVLFSLSPAWTKAGGLLFFVFLGWALWVGLRWPRMTLASTPALDWLVIATLALVLRGAATVYWGDSWGARHFEGRFFLMALAGWCLLKTCWLSPRQKQIIDLALALACWVALAVVLRMGRDTPTNTLPWAAGVGFVACILAGRASTPDRAWLARGGLWLSVMVGGIAVLLSQSRGSYGLIVWLMVVFFLMVWRLRLKPHSRKVTRWALVVLIAAASLAALFSQVLRTPQERIAVAVQEAKKLSDALGQGQVSASALDTSVGARLYMWVRAVDESHRFMVAGIGQVERRAWVKDLGRQSGSEVIASLDHLHSDPLTIWFEHGLLGVASYLVIALGLLWLAWRARRLQAGAAMGVAGLAFMHITAGLTNFNTMHNFYGIMLSLCILLALWLAAPGRQGGR